ncbi:MAG: transporter related protein [Marmoricola sp.]|nr:transporter related protein [Marmoricola sp.]
MSHLGTGSGPLLTLQGVEKRFGGVHALKGADLTITRPGVVHVLIGENGSGKSTLLGVLSGQLRHDAGSMRLRGRTVRFADPVAALGQGVAMVSQETAVAPDLTVGENVLLGRGLVRRWSGISRAATNAKASEVLSRLGLDYDPRARVGDLRPDQRQMVEIARALSADASVLILDEPTSSLTDDEVQGLFRAIRELKEQGVAIVFVSHRIPELFEIGDEVTVLRDGNTVAQGPISDFDGRSLVRAMVGDVEGLASRPAGGSAARGTATAPVALKVAGLVADDAVHDVGLDVRRGEIVGLAGLVGAGRSELLEAVFGSRPLSAGHLEVAGRPYVPAGPRHAIRSGIGFLPPDRKSQGLVLGMSVGSNVTMVQTSRRSRWSPPRRAAAKHAVAEVVTSMRLKTPSHEAPVGALSGGGQQKVGLAKWLVCEPCVLLLDEPTRGVDVTAKAEIHAQLRRVAAGGTAVLVSSSENDELLALCDRVLVMFRGCVVADLSTETATEAELLRLAGGHTS